MTWPDATAHAELVRREQVSPKELVDDAIERIERVNPQINAVIQPRYDKARQEASAALPDGPFRGVPMVVKDLGLTMKGDPYHLGTRVLKNAGYVAPYDSYLARRFRNAGFVVVGRTNTPEFGSTITTEPLAYGPARNPWNLDHSTGGSSGGSAAAVAAGLVTIGHANDGGGSIRIPASECGLVGLKPSRGRVSQGPDVGEGWAGATIDHVVTRSVRDSAGVLDAIHGYEVGDLYVAPDPARPYAAEVGADPGSLRIGVLDHPLMGVPAHPECAAAVNDAGRLLESLGHRVEAAWPEAVGDETFSSHFVNVLSVASTTGLALIEELVGRPLTGDDIEPGNLFFAELGRSLPAHVYLTSEQWMHTYTRRVEAWWHPGADGTPGFDLLVTPVLAGPPPPIGYLSDPEQGLNRVIELLQYTAQFNVTGQPAISLPLHWTADGLPVGVQLVAAYGREDVLIRIASQLEQAQPWADRVPPVHA